MPTTQEWLERLREDEPVIGLSSDDIVGAIREGRAERNEQIRGALADGD